MHITLSDHPWDQPEADRCRFSIALLKTSSSTCPTWSSVTKVVLSSTWKMKHHFFEHSFPCFVLYLRHTVPVSSLRLRLVDWVIPTDSLFSSWSSSSPVSSKVKRVCKMQQVTKSDLKRWKKKKGSYLCRLKLLLHNGIWDVGYERGHILKKKKMIMSFVHRSNFLAIRRKPGGKVWHGRTAGDDQGVTKMAASVGRKKVDLSWAF